MIFTVEIDLTDKGLIHWTQVVKAVYLEMLRRYPKGGLPAYLHEETKQIAQMSFQFMQEKDQKGLQYCEVLVVYWYTSTLPAFPVYGRTKISPLVPVSSLFSPPQTDTILQLTANSP